VVRYSILYRSSSHVSQKSKCQFARRCITSRHRWRLTKTFSRNSGFVNLSYGPSSSLLLLVVVTSASCLHLNPIDRALWRRIITLASYQSETYRGPTTHDAWSHSRADVDNCYAIAVNVFKVEPWQTVAVKVCQLQKKHQLQNCAVQPYTSIKNTRDIISYVITTSVKKLWTQRYWTDSSDVYRSCWYLWKKKSNYYWETTTRLVSFEKSP